MSDELNPADFKRGVIAQREHRSGRITARDPKKVKLTRRMFADEEWQLHTKYHTRSDAEKAARQLFKRDSHVPKHKYQIDGQDFQP